MTSEQVERRRQVAKLTRRKNSQRSIAGELGVSQTRVRQLLTGQVVGAARLHEAFLETASTAYLERYERALVDRLRRDIALLRTARSELESRRIDEIIGLG